MQIEGKTLSFDKSLWVQFGGVDIEERGEQIAVTGQDEESYLKVFNHFGRLLKLYTFENGNWLDADTALPAQPFDDSRAGRLPPAAVAAVSSARARSKAPSVPAKGRRSVPQAATGKTPVKARATKPSKAKESRSGPSSSGKAAGGKGRGRGKSG